MNKTDLKAPEGCVVLGYGGTFKIPGELVYGWSWSEDGKGWLGAKEWYMEDDSLIFAAPADSEVARMNSPEKPGGSETPRADAAWQYCYPECERPNLELARTLERELAAQSALIGELAKALKRLRLAYSRVPAHPDTTRDELREASLAGDEADETIRRADGKEAEE